MFSVLRCCRTNDDVVVYWLLLQMNSTADRSGTVGGAGISPSLERGLTLPVHPTYQGSTPVVSIPLLLVIVDLS